MTSRFEITDIIPEKVTSVIGSKLYKRGLNQEQQKEFYKTPRGAVMKWLYKLFSWIIPKVGRTDRIRIYLRPQR